MARPLSAEDLLAGASLTYRVAIPAELIPSAAEQEDKAGIAGEVTLRPLTLRDVQRVSQAAKDTWPLSSALMVQQALVSPKLTVEQVGAMPAGVVRFLLAKVNAISGLGLGDDDLEAMVKQPLARACFILAREFGWTPNECAELTLGQVLLYVEMLARGDSPEEGAA